MKWRRVSACVLAILLCLVMVACGTNEDDTSSPQSEPLSDSSAIIDTASTADEAEGSTPLLYRVTDEDGTSCYLFGSIHVGEKAFYPLPDYVTQALEDAGNLWVEFDIVAFEGDLSAQVECLKLYLYMDGTTIRDHISPKVYQAAKEILQDNDQYVEQMDYYMPAMWTDMINSILYDKIKVKSSLGVDRHLIEQAKDMGKPVRDVESAKEQIGMMASYSPKLQETLLEEAIASYADPDKESEEIKKLQKAWARGNEKEMSALINEEVTFADTEEKALYEEYQKALLTDRDMKMTQHVEQLLETDQEDFVCVGAAHVLGEGGMIDQLEARGYKVELVR